MPCEGWLKYTDLIRIIFRVTLRPNVIYIIPLWPQPVVCCNYVPNVPSSAEVSLRGWGEGMRGVVTRNVRVETRKFKSWTLKWKCPPSKQGSRLPPIHRTRPFPKTKRIRSPRRWWWWWGGGGGGGEDDDDGGGDDGDGDDDDDDGGSGDDDDDCLLGVTKSMKNSYGLEGERGQRVSSWILITSRLLRVTSGQGRQTRTDKHGQAETETKRERQRETERDRDRQTDKS